MSKSKIITTISRPDVGKGVDNERIELSANQEIPSPIGRTATRHPNVASSHAQIATRAKVQPQRRSISLADA